MPGVVPNQYLILLCTAAQEADQSFGPAMRIGTSHSKFNAEMTKVIHSILTFSPAPDSMAMEFLNELEKVSGISHLGEWPVSFLQGFTHPESKQSSQLYTIPPSLTPPIGLQRL